MELLQEGGIGIISKVPGSDVRKTVNNHDDKLSNIIHTFSSDVQDTIVRVEEEGVAVGVAFEVRV